jgi:hypothetical protein
MATVVALGAKPQEPELVAALVLAVVLRVVAWMLVQEPELVVQSSVVWMLAEGLALAQGLALELELAAKAAAWPVRGLVAQGHPARPPDYVHCELAGVLP